MPFSWDNFPYTNFHELNLDWFIKKFKEIFDEWESLYTTLTQWKDDTDADLTQWKEDTLSDMTSWENNLLDALDRWKAATGEDIGEWEAGVISDLNDWKDDFIAAYEAIEDRVDAIVSDTEEMVENLAPAFSSSDTYRVGTEVIYNGVLYRFKEDHSAGAWNSDEVYQITAMDRVERNFNALSEFNPVSFSDQYGTFRDNVSNGVSFTWHGNVCTVSYSGNEEVSTFNNILANTACFKGNFASRPEYYIHVQTSDPDHVYLRIYPYINNVLDTHDYTEYKEDGLYKLPENCTGIVARIEVSTDTALNETITASVLTNRLDYNGSEYIFPTGDTTDRHDDILNKIETYGVCRLAIGDYYIGSPVIIPSNTLIIGDGHGTRIHKINDSYRETFVVNNTNKQVTIKDLAFIGTNTEKPTADSSSSKVALGIHNTAGIVTVENVIFEGWDSYGVLCESGYNNCYSIELTNCTFKWCNRAIMMAQYGEYAKINNCIFTECYLGAYVTGGNNMFTQCSFTHCVTGLYIYDHTAPGNNGHGTAEGCNFNHNDNYSVRLNNISNGYTFIGCQIFYGPVVVNNSDGVQFIGCRGRCGSDTPWTFTNCSGSILVLGTILSGNGSFSVTNCPNLVKANCYKLDGTVFS